MRGAAEEVSSRMDGQEKYVDYYGSFERLNFFMQVEEELHDLRRVHAHGQEDDLKMALNRCMNRVGEVVGLLRDAYVVLSEMQIEIDVTRSNLQMIEKNNEMLEDALKDLSQKVKLFFFFYPFILTSSSCFFTAWNQSEGCRKCRMEEVWADIRVFVNSYQYFVHRPYQQQHFRFE